MSAAFSRAVTKIRLTRAFSHAIEMDDDDAVMCLSKLVLLSNCHKLKRKFASLSVDALVTNCDVMDLATVGVHVDNVGKAVCAEAQCGNFASVDKILKPLWRLAFVKDLHYEPISRRLARHMMMLMLIASNAYASYGKPESKPESKKHIVELLRPHVSQNEMQDLFWFAAEHGHTDVTQFIYAMGFTLSPDDESTALVTAIYRHRPAMVKCILEWSSPSLNMWHVLASASLCGTCEIMELLLADPRSQPTKAWLNMRIMLAGNASKADMVEFLRGELRARRGKERRGGIAQLARLTPLPAPLTDIVGDFAYHPTKPKKQKEFKVVMF